MTNFKSVAQMLWTARGPALPPSDSDPIVPGTQPPADHAFELYYNFIQRYRNPNWRNWRKLSPTWATWEHKAVISEDEAFEIIALMTSPLTIIHEISPIDVHVGITIDEATTYLERVLHAVMCMNLSLYVLSEGQKSLVAYEHFDARWFFMKDSELQANNDSRQELRRKRQ